MRFNLALLSLLIVFCSIAQTYNPSKINPKAKNIYAKAMIQLSNEQFLSSIPLLEKCIILDSNYVDAYLSLAGVMGQLKANKLAVKFYEIAQKKDTTYFKPYFLPYSINLAGIGRFDSSLNLINQFLTLPNVDEVSKKSAEYRKKCYAFGVEYKKKHPDNGYLFSPKNLGDSVNTELSEYLPTLSVDDSLLVFSRRSPDGGEYFYRSPMITPSHFGKATLIPGDLNQENFKGALTVSADGEWMIFAANIHGKTFGDYDLYISYYTPNGWSEPENMGETINSEYWESSPSLSPDKRALYFSSNRPGGFGGKDLYVSYRDVKGRWGTPINLGREINTKADEQAPFIHADNQTLYYTSNGLLGYGGTDLFVIRQKADGNWRAPENLGFPINTIENEGSLAIAPNGIDAYYASDRSDTRGGLDLYHFELREDVRPAKTVYVKGFVYDEQTKRGLPSNVELIDNNTGKPLMLVQTDETGFYFITLPTGRDFTFNVNRMGYLFYSKIYGLKDKMADSIYHENIYLNPLSLNASLILKNIQFDINDFKIKETSKVELNKVVQLLQQNPNIHIVVNGHTDNVGNAIDNQLLSSNRAKAVMEFFILRGITSVRLQYKGYGATKPIADNNTESGRAINRRTEIQITAM